MSTRDENQRRADTFSAKYAPRIRGLCLFMRMQYVRCVGVRAAVDFDIEVSRYVRSQW